MLPYFSEDSQEFVYAPVIGNKLFFTFVFLLRGEFPIFFRGIKLINIKETAVVAESFYRFYYSSTLSVLDE